MRDDEALGLVGESSKEQGKELLGTSCCSCVHKYTHTWTANKPSVLPICWLSFL